MVQRIKADARVRSRAPRDMDAANLSDVGGSMAWFSAAADHRFVRRVWGPVREQAAALAGSAREAKSVCINAPHLSQFVVAAALECIPSNLLPRKSDTAETLAERLSESVFLHDAHPLRSGNGKPPPKEKLKVREVGITKFIPMESRANCGEEPSPT